MSFKELLTGKTTYTTKLSYDDLVNAEAEIGRTIFGPIPIGHQREFFTHKRNVWIWYERWIDRTGIPQEMTVRYEVRPAGVYKKVSGGAYTKLEGTELSNFRQAVHSYFNLVKKRLYS